jgi:hypothetical protein
VNKATNLVARVTFLLQDKWRRKGKKSREKATYKGGNVQNSIPQGRGTLQMTVLAAICAALPSNAAWQTGFDPHTVPKPCVFENTF